MKNIIIILTYFLLFNSCEYIDFMNKDGELVEYEITTGNIRYLIIEASYSINLTNKASETIHIKGYDYLTDGIDFLQKGDTLIIDNNHYFLQKSKLIELTIYGSNIESITANTVCQINCIENIHTHRFSIVMNGSSQYSETNLDLTCEKLNLNVFGLNNVGNHIIKGKTCETNYRIEGSVNIDALQLETQTTNITHKSIGFCKVNVSDKLNVSTYSTGNTYYIGTPTINQEHIDLPYLTSTGEVISIN